MDDDEVALEKDSLQAIFSVGSAFHLTDLFRETTKSWDQVRYVSR